MFGIDFVHISWAIQQLQLPLFSGGCTVTPFTPIYLFHSSLLYLQKCLLTVHQGASGDSLSISLSFSLSSDSITERPPLRAPYSSTTQCLQKTHKGLHGASNQPYRRAGELGQCPGTNSIAMILHSSLLPQAPLKIEFITQLEGSRDNLSACLHRVSPHLKLHSATNREM